MSLSPISPMLLSSIRLKWLVKFSCKLLSSVYCIYIIYIAFLSLQKFFETHPAPAAERKIQQSVENIRLNAKWMERESTSVLEFLRSQWIWNCTARSSQQLKDEDQNDCVTKAIIGIIYEQIVVWSFIISSFPYNIKGNLQNVV